MNEWIWYGVFDRKGDLVDASPGEYHAVEAAVDLTKKTKVPHEVAPVLITRLKKEAVAAAAEEISVEERMASNG